MEFLFIINDPPCETKRCYNALRLTQARPPRNVSHMSNGKSWLWAKRFFANYYLWKLRRGANRSLKWVW